MKKYYILRLFAAALFAVTVLCGFTACGGNVTPPDEPPKVRISKEEEVGALMPKNIGSEHLDDFFIVGCIETAPTAEEAPWGVAGSKKYQIKNPTDQSWYGFHIVYPDGRLFKANTSYMVVFDLMFIEDNMQDGVPCETLWTQPIHEIPLSQKLILPEVGTWKTMSAVFDKIDGGDDYIDFFAMPCDIVIAVGNIRILELIAGVTDNTVSPLPVSVFNITQLGEQAVIKNLRGGLRHNGKGVLVDGSFAFGGMGRNEGDGNIRLIGAFDTPLAAGSYSFSMDFRPFEILGTSEVCIKIGTHIETVDTSDFSMFVTQRIEFDFELAAASTAAFSVYLNKEYDPDVYTKLVCIMSNLVISAAD